MFLVALAAAAASTHSVTGAFGYTLGQAPPAKVATCNRTWLAQSNVTVFGCPGDGFFTNVDVTTRRNQVTNIMAFRRYPAGALKACLADVNRLKAQIRRDIPGLLDARNGSVTFDLSERLVQGGWAAGRYIIGNCKPQEQLAKYGGDYVSLSLTYWLSGRESVELITLDQAEAKKK
jgi:hypothetical protein